MYHPAMPAFIHHHLTRVAPHYHCPQTYHTHMCKKTHTHVYTVNGHTQTYLHTTTMILSLYSIIVLYTPIFPFCTPNSSLSLFILCFQQVCNDTISCIMHAQIIYLKQAIQNKRNLELKCRKLIAGTMPIWAYGTQMAQNQSDSHSYESTY